MERAELDRHIENRWLVWYFDERQLQRYVTGFIPYDNAWWDDPSSRDHLHPSPIGAYEDAVKFYEEQLASAKAEYQDGRLVKDQSGNLVDAAKPPYPQDGASKRTPPSHLGRKPTS